MKLLSKAVLVALVLLASSGAFAAIGLLVGPNPARSGKPLDAEVRRAAGILASVTKPVREGSLFDALLAA